MAREGQNGFVPGAFLQGAGLHPSDGFANQLVGPGALAARGLICSVEDEKNVVLRRLLKQRLIKVDHFFGFVIKEVDLGAAYADVAQHFEKFLSRFRSAQILAVLPEPHANSLLPGIIDDFFPLLWRPFAPETLDDVVFETELSRHAGEFLHAIRAVGTTI